MSRTDPPPRIAYQSFGPASNTDYLASLGRQLGELADRYGAVIDVKTVSDASMGGKQHRSLQHLDTAVLTRRAWQYAADGYAAMVIGNVQDPGLLECRQLVDIPVLGLLESTLSMLPAFADRACLVLTHLRVERTVREAAGVLSARIHSTVGLDAHIGAMADDYRTRAGAAGDAVRAFRKRAAQALAAGADVVVPAAGMLAALIEDASRDDTADGHELRRLQDDGRLWCPIRAAVGYAYAAATLAGQGRPISHSGSYERPERGEIERYFAQVDRLTGR